MEMVLNVILESKVGVSEKALEVTGETVDVAALEGRLGCRVVGYQVVDFREAA